jgi:hypothetical protein
MASVTLTLKNRQNGVTISDEQKRTALHNILDGIYPILEARRVGNRTLTLFSLYIERGLRRGNLHLQGVMEFAVISSSNVTQTLARETRWLRVLFKRLVMHESIAPGPRDQARPTI